MLVAAIAALAGSFAACAHVDTATAEPVRLPPQPEHRTREGAPVDPSLQKFVDMAIEDLARRLGVDRSAISVIDARPVVWPDRSLGCPRPGMNYPQVQQDGLRIRLAALGKEFAYHSGGARAPFLCENPR